MYGPSFLYYCVFEDPKAKTYIEFNDFDKSQCKMAITVSEKNTGIWKCGMVTTYSERTIKDVLVKIAKPLTALQPMMTVEKGSPCTLTCIASQPKNSLTYCRFISPRGTLINLNEDVTEENSIYHRYYLPSGHRLDNGYCSMTIDVVTNKDLGTWQCEAGWPSGEQYSDTIYLGNSFQWIVKLAVLLVIICNIIKFIVYPTLLITFLVLLFAGDIDLFI